MKVLSLSVLSSSLQRLKTILATDQRSRYWMATSHYVILDSNLDKALEDKQNHHHCLHTFNKQKHHKD